MLSEVAGDMLLQLLKDIIRHAESISRYFIYDRIENINGAVTKAISQQTYQGMEINITLPTRLCGSDQIEIDNIKRVLDFRNTNLSDFIIAKGNRLNVV